MAKRGCLISVMLLFMVVGCATPVKKYTLSNDEQSYAEIRSNIGGAYNRNELIQIFVMGDGGCGIFNYDHIKNQKLLFSIRKSLSEPQAYVRVGVDKSVRLHYFEEASGGRTCEVMLEAKLESGKKVAYANSCDHSEQHLRVEGADDRIDRVLQQQEALFRVAR